MNNVQTHICNVKNSGLEHYLPTSANDRVISRYFAKMKPSRKFLNLWYMLHVTRIADLWKHFFNAVYILFSFQTGRVM